MKPLRILSDRRIYYAILYTVLVHHKSLYAQHTTGQPTQVLTINLTEALTLAKSNNRNIQKAKLQLGISEELINEKKEIQLPDIDLHTSYYRMSNLVEYQHSDVTKFYKTIPDIYDITLNAKMPIYMGHKIKYAIQKAEKEHELENIQLEKITNDKQIEVIQTYLGICKLIEFKKLLTENLREEEERLKVVKAFQKNGTVTKEEVLQAELQRSDIQLATISNDRNLAVLSHDLKTLLQIPENDSLTVDSNNAIAPHENLGSIEQYLAFALNKEELRMAQTHTEINLLDRKSVKANYYPTVSFFGTFGFNYPNYMLFLFPPHPYLYSLGRAGIDINYSISNLFKNKTKMSIATQKIQISQVQKDIVKDEIYDNVFRKYMAYQEAQDKIRVTQKAINQAEENYRIIKNKYFNQLALHTDMMDADNALLRTRYNHLSIQIEATAKYYDLLYACGKL